MATCPPKYGATSTISPIDEVTLDYLRLTGRSADHVELVERYAKEQGLFHELGAPEPAFSEVVTLDLSDVEPSIAGPCRPQESIGLSRGRRAFRAALAKLEPDAIKPSVGASRYRRFSTAALRRRPLSRFPPATRLPPWLGPVGLETLFF